MIRTRFFLLRDGPPIKIENTYEEIAPFKLNCVAISIPRNESDAEYGNLKLSARRIYERAKGRVYPFWKLVSQLIERICGLLKIDWRKFPMR